MKKQVLFIHGAGVQGPYQGSGELAAYLQEALGAEYDVLYPIMPGSENPDYTSWKAQIKKELAAVQNQVILIGHSLGGAVLLKFLSEETNQKTISGLFIVAAPYWGKEDDWQNDQYVLHEDFTSTLPQIPRIFLYHSLHDEVVPFEHLALYAEKLPAATIRTLDSYGHYFNDGFPELVDDIKGKIGGT